MKVISKDVSFPSINNSSTDYRSKLRKRSEIVSPRHQLQRKIHKKCSWFLTEIYWLFQVDCCESTNEVNWSRKVCYRNFFLPISQDQSIENNTKRILTHILKRWDGNNSSAPPSADTITPTEVVALNVYSVELKYYCLYFLIYPQ